MEFRKNSVCGIGMLLLLILVGIDVQSTAAQNRCDRNIQVMTRSECHLCSISEIMNCPAGYSKKTTGKGKQDCRYQIKTSSMLALSLLGCSHTCFKDVVEEHCCSGYWGYDCLECPGSAATPCSNNGVCSDGIGGSGNCTCKEGFEGTACEKCEENRYGPTCSNVCTCKHGLCNSGLRGNGECTCFSGYTGPDCDQELPDCSALRCGSDARCFEDTTFGKLVCKCLPGYFGDGVQCSSINPCQKRVCHDQAVCVHTGPNQHTCTCTEGYQGDGLVCLPIDPCQTDYGGCQSNSSRCLYDGPGKAHCECLEGFEKLTLGVGCSLRDVCKADSCHKNAYCTTVAPKTVECKCKDGFLGNGNVCFGNIIQRLRELNTDPKSRSYGQLSSAISLFEGVMSWPLTSLGPFTVFVPKNRAFKSAQPVKTLLADQAKARYLVKIHMIPGEVNSDTLKNGILYYTLTGKSAESITESGQVKVRIHGSRKKAALLESDIISSNGMIHITDKLLDTVPSTVISDNQENLMKILSDNGKFSIFKSLIEKTSMVDLLDKDGPYTLFAPTNAAFTLMKDDQLNYLKSQEGKPKLLEFLRNHVVASAQLKASYIVSISQTVSMANQVLTINVTAAGQILVNGVAVAEADVEAKNGCLYSMEDVLIPPSIQPILPHRCDVRESNIYKSPCVSCASVSQAICSTGVSLNTTSTGCLYKKKTFGMDISVLGCNLFCNETRTTPQCCKGFYGADCSPCPGGFSAPCSSHGKCLDGIEGNGTCQCEPNFKGWRCQYCADPNKYGPFCNQTCRCVRGVCDNRPEANGACKPNTCQQGITGELCDNHARPCGPSQTCHIHANCILESDGKEQCVCKPGYMGDGFQCMHEDPCTWSPNGGCGDNARCVQLGMGRHKCECLSGWKEDGDECQPVNNCLEPSRGGCHPNASCVYVGPGQNDCVCKQNFRGTGTDCEPVNPCVNMMGGCHQMASCVMYPGKFECVCQSGYMGDGRICYGYLAQELETNLDLSGFNTWVTRADLTQMMFEKQNMTLFVPSLTAVNHMSKEDQDFWLSASNIQSLVMGHVVSGLYRLSDLRSSPSPQLVSNLRGTLPISWINETTMVAGATIISGDIVTKNGLIHLIDKVLIPDRKMSTGLLGVLDRRPEFSLFKSALITYNLSTEIEEASGFTVFAPTDSAIREYLKNTGQDSLDVNVTRYHIVLDETLMQGDLQNGLYKDTMLGISYQLGIFHNDNNWFVNKAQMNATDIETDNGVIHGLSAVLKIPKNRCDTASSRHFWGKCMDCFRPPENPCPAGTKKKKLSPKRCLFTVRKYGRFIGCAASCERSIIKRKCCEGFYGTDCETCPGPEGQPCFGNGVCVDGINGTGVCQCSPGFNGTACENCQTGKYGIHCDQDCKCENGRCFDGLKGDGSCQCDVGWRGIYCSIAITSDMCKGKCHTSANCLIKIPDNSYYCSCAAGFEGNGTHCTVVDACAKNNGDCSPNAVCKRTLPGRRQCVCNPGYAGDGQVCVSINPCLDGNGGCGNNSQCVHTGSNKSACVCLPGYSGNGKTCSPINMCRKKNGGCHPFAVCTMTGPGERNCTCPRNHIGDGIFCKDKIIHELRRKGLTTFVYDMQRADIYFLQSRGPYTVFAPNNNAFHKMVNEKVINKEKNAAILLYHIVPCRSLLPIDLQQPRNLTALNGEILTITYSEGTILINNNAKVVYSDQESSNGIFYEIDTVLTPPSYQKMNKTVEANSALKDVADQHGFKSFYKLLEDTEVIRQIEDPLHQPVTLFLPTDSTMAALPQAQKDFLYGLHNRDQLREYLEYHILLDRKLHSAEVLHYDSLKTLQGSDVSVSCVGEDHIGALYINNKNCRIVKQNLNFKEGLVYGIDCLLTPPSLGGHCDEKDIVDITMPCRHCGYTKSDCPAVTKPKSKLSCDLPRHFLSLNSGCQSVCSMVIWKPKCCPGYYGRDCLACPGGPKSPCSNHGRCDDDNLGNGTCTCDTGFQGVACELCTDGHFGPDCKACKCTEHGTCNEGQEGTGSCFCEEGWTGPQCEHKLADGPLCLPACHKKAVCTENSTCVCKPFYEGDGITCKVTNMCQLWNGGCSRNAKCTQKGEKVNCTCLKDFSGDGYVCMPADPCVKKNNGGCNEHALCTMTGPGKRKCECKTNYVGDGLTCELKVFPVNRCMVDNGQCHLDAQCTDLHYEDKTLGVFLHRSPLGTYKLNYTEAQEACKQAGGTIATYTQLAYAQQAGYSMCSAGWLAQKRVGYPMSYSSPSCGFGHVGIVDYGTQTDLSKTWDTFCYRIKDVKCECKIGYIGDGYSCTGNILQVLTTKPNLSNFLSQILNYSTAAAKGLEFMKCLSNLTTQSTLFVPDNNGLFENQTLSNRDLEHHLLHGRALVLQDLINISHVKSYLGNTLNVKRVPSLQNPQTEASSGYVNDRYIIESDILASNGIIHVLQGPLKAPPLPPPSLPQAHSTGLGIGVILLIILIVAAAFVAYHFYNRQTKPFQFHYFREDEQEHTSSPESYISNPMYETTAAPSAPDLPVEDKDDKHQVVDGGSYDLLQDI